jgi:hypothetical protein
MRRWAAPWWGDLAAVVALTLAGLFVALIPVPDSARAAALLPLVLFLPGYALTAALFLPGEISRELRLVLSGAFSLAVSALGGLAVQLVIGLDRPVWAALLASATGAFALVALRRRDALPAEQERRGVGLPLRVALSLVPVLGAMAIAGWAIALATDGAHRQADRSRFSSLSLVGADPSRAPSPVRIGVLNHEGEPVAYRLVIRRGTRTIRRWRLHLGANQDWQTQLASAAIAGTGPLVGRLDRGGEPYHRVVLRLRGAQ